MRISNSTLQHSDLECAISATLSALSRHGLGGCVFGSAAAYFHGMKYRIPNDIDIVVINPSPAQTSEIIKTLIVQSDGRFFLVPSRISGATHQVLWISLSDPDLPEDKRSNPKVAPVKSRSKPQTRGFQSGSSQAATPTSTRLCKVDILIPSTYLGIETLEPSLLSNDSHFVFPSYCDLSTHTVQTQQTIQPVSCIPLPTLILFKLAVWRDCSAPDAPQRLIESMSKHELDIQQLLNILMAQPTTNKGSTHLPHWRFGGLHNIHERSRCIAKYVKKWPETSMGWFIVSRALE